MIKTDIVMIVLGLDVSTKTIGYTIIDYKGKDDFEVLECSFIQPKLSKRKYSEFDLSKTNKHFHKAKIVKDELSLLKERYNVDLIVLEEPLFGSNNRNTVNTLLRFNGMVSFICFEVFGGILPQYIHSTTARKNVLPNVKYNGDNRKELIFSNVTKTYKDKLNKEYILNRNGNISEENYDAIDSFVTALGYCLCMLK